MILNSKAENSLKENTVSHKFYNESTRDTRATSETKYRDNGSLNSRPSFHAESLARDDPLELSRKHWSNYYYEIKEEDLSDEEYVTNRQLTLNCQTSEDIYL